MSLPYVVTASLKKIFTISSLPVNNYTVEKEKEEIVLFGIEQHCINPSLHVITVSIIVYLLSIQFSYAVVLAHGN